MDSISNATAAPNLAVATQKSPESGGDVQAKIDDYRSNAETVKIAVSRRDDESFNFKKTQEDKPEIGTFGPQEDEEQAKSIAEESAAKLEELANKAMADNNVRLSISFREDAQRFVYQGIDRETGEVVREYPPEEVIDRIAELREVVGAAFDKQV